MAERLFRVAHDPDRRFEIVRGEIGVAFSGSPDLIDGLAHSVAQARTHWGRLRSVILEGKIELQHFRRKGLDRRVLPRIDAVGGPDQEAGDQRAEQREKPDDSANHIARRAGCVFLVQHSLHDEADQSAAEDGGGDGRSELFRTHRRPQRIGGGQPLASRLLQQTRFFKPLKVLWTTA